MTTKRHVTRNCVSTSASDTRRFANKWAGERCYLNGRPARILGRLNRVATVAILPDGSHEEFSWNDVDCTMQHDKSFDAQWS